MPPTDLSERGLETRIVERLTGRAGTAPPGMAGESPRPGFDLGPIPRGGWVEGDPKEFDRQHLFDVPALLRFVEATQPRAWTQLGIAEPGTKRDAFLARLSGEIAQRGVVEVLRDGISHQNVAHLALFYGTPSPGNEEAARRYAQNTFRVTRQVRYSLDETARALDLVLFVNGLPLATFELKNRLTNQDVDDAIRQYRTDRSPAEPLFRPGRCAVHFAVDEDLIRYCTELRGQDSVFLPFDRGNGQGAGNPPNPHGLRTDWLWDELLAPDSLVDIVENYAHVVREKDAAGKKRERVLWPRYHQIDAARKALAHARAHGAGHRYLIQHSAGSGKSNTIAWLVHQLIELQDAEGNPLFDTVVVVTDRRVLDTQLRNTIRSFTRVGATVGAAERSGQLREFIEGGKRIVVSTVQKFPFILDEISDEHRHRRFAIVIDEAHSSQGGKASTAINSALGSADRGGSEASDDDGDVEDAINALLDKRIAERRLLENASYFAFTATPKNRTLEIFGSPDPARPGAKVPFHVYSMKQAIEEGFILDVLQNYTPVRSWYRLVKTVEGDPEYEVREASKRLRKFVENEESAIAVKAAIAADHFRDHVVGTRKIGGKARAMVVVDGVDRAITWWRALSDYLVETNAPYSALIAFSGERDYAGARVTEATLNGFPSAEIPERFRDGDYRFLVVADKFQTGYDEPLLHTMYADKVLAGVKAVQTLSRLNRAHPGKRDTFVLDFANEEDAIQAAFQPYYQTTVLSGETDPNKLHDLQSRLDGAGVYDLDLVDRVVTAFLRGEPREHIDPLLDGCVDRYSGLDEEEQIEFKGGAKAFVRSYEFLASLLDWANRGWEKRAIFLRLLVPKLPTPVGMEIDDLSDLLEQVDLDSYRAEVLEGRNIGLVKEDGAVDPANPGAGGMVPPVEKLPLSQLVAEFNSLFGNIAWNDRDRIQALIAEELPRKVADDERYRNAIRQGDRQNARVEHDRALRDAIVALVNDQVDLYKHFSDNDDFRRFVTDSVFKMTYQPPGQ